MSYCWLGIYLTGAIIDQTGKGVLWMTRLKKQIDFILEDR